MDRRQPVRRQPAGHGRDRHRATGCGSTCATSPRRSSASAPRATTSPRRSRRWAGSSTSTAASTTSAPTARPSSTASTNVGHLGIFVSGGVAKKEHQEFATNIDLIDCLPPGLYEAVLTPVGETGGCRTGSWSATMSSGSSAHAGRHPRPGRQRPRGRAQVRRGGAALGDQSRPLPHVPAALGARRDDRASGASSCAGSARPGCSSSCSPTGTRSCSRSRPRRSWSGRVAGRSSADNPFLAAQEFASQQIVAALDGYRDWRDAMVEASFHAIYGSPLVQALLGLRASDDAATAAARPRARGDRVRPAADRGARGGGWIRAACARRSSARSSTSGCPSWRPTSAASPC